MSVAGLVVIGGVWYSDDYSNPLLSWWESADTPGLSSPPLALNMCKQNICMANIAHTTNATSFFPATLNTDSFVSISKLYGCII